MNKLLNRIKLFFIYGAELDEIVKKLHNEKVKLEREAKKDNLKLCFKHQQESGRSHYAEHNCDYCKLLKQLENREP